jgi:hypothetical protein
METSLKFDEFSTLVHQILELEFTGRDRDIQSGVTSVKQKLHARGVLNSTMTLQSLSDFFLAEFQARLDLVADHTMSALRTDGASVTGSTGPPMGVELFRSLAREQIEAIRRAYDGSVEAIVASLQSNMPDQIRTDLIERLQTNMQKRGLVVELEYKLAANPSKELLTLRPTLYGVGIDLKEMWKKFFG